MTTTICFDLGNTRKKAAIFKEDELDTVIILSDNNPEYIDQLLSQYAPNRSILSSVIDHSAALEILLGNTTVFHKVSSESRLNFKLDIEKPATIGPDRLALAAAAVQHFPARHNLVIAMGSCITYNFINQYHHFLGGAISPGLKMRAQALHQYTAKLPLVNLNFENGNPLPPLVGYNTTSTLQSGIFNGIACEVDGVIERYRSRYRDLNVVLTGGNAPYFVSQCKSRIFADPNFLFKGLYALSQINCGNE